MTKPFIGRLDPPNYDYYLGDGVYATFDGFQVWLDCRGDARVCRQGEEWFSKIGLDRETMQKLIAYEAEVIKQYKPDST